MTRTMPSMPEASAPDPHPLTVLQFMAVMLARKFRRRLSDLDIIVMLALAHSPHPLRFHRVIEACGCSQTGAWNALERLADHGLVQYDGPRGAHAYSLTQDGIREIRHLAGK